jgi:hypothetical protein
MKMSLEIIPHDVLRMIYRKLDIISAYVLTIVAKRFRYLRWHTSSDFSYFTEQQCLYYGYLGVFKYMYEKYGQKQRKGQITLGAVGCQTANRIEILEWLYDRNLLETSAWFYVDDRELIRWAIEKNITTSDEIIKELEEYNAWNKIRWLRRGMKRKREVEQISWFNPDTDSE